MNKFEVKISKVEILVATYNGEKYLKEQLDSLLAQECSASIKITVRDDGSKDGTRKILKSYQEKFGIHVIYGENIGINKCMINLIENASTDSDYFAFCDQDDVWHKDKIKFAVDCLNKEDNDLPLLWGCMEEVTDKDLNYTAMMPTPKCLGDFYNAIVQNKMAGHTQVFNKALRSLFLKFTPDEMYIYDWVTYIIASGMGKVFFEKHNCGKYRQHGNNTIGYKKGYFSQITGRFKRLANGRFKLVALQMDCLGKTFDKELKCEYKRELYEFLNSRQTFIKRAKYIFRTKIKRDSKFESLQFRILYLIGVFGK